MRPVNLIPPDQRRGDKAPARTGQLPWIVIAGAVGVLLLVFMTVSAQSSISERSAELTALEQREERATATANALRAFADFAGVSQSRQETVTSLAESRFDWERVLREIALVIPGGVRLDTFDASTAGADADEGAGSAPTLLMSGCSDSNEVLAGFVRALEDVDGITQAGFTTATSSASPADGPAPAPGDGAAPTVGVCEGPTFEVTATFGAVTVDATTQMPVFPEAASGKPLDEAAEDIEGATELIPGVEG